MSDLPAILGGAPAFQKQNQYCPPGYARFSEVADGVQDILRTGMVTKGEHLKSV